MFAALEAKGYDPYYAELLHEAFAQTKDPARAIQTADSIFKKHPRKKPDKPEPRPQAPTINVPQPVVNVPQPVINMQVPAPVINMAAPIEKPRPKIEFTIKWSNDGNTATVTEK